MPFERQYDADELVRLLRVNDGLTTSELAEKMDANVSTTWYRCQTLEEEDRIEGMRFGADGLSRQWRWYAVEE